MAGPALGLIETASIARGVVVGDAMAKRAAVEIVAARPISPGKYVVLVSGSVAEVSEAMTVGVETAGATLVDRLELADAAGELLRALARKAPPPVELSVGLIEVATVAAALLAADAACKAAEVELAELRLADGIGGKAYFVISGELDQVEAGLLAAESILAAGALVGRELIASPHQDILAKLRR